VVTLGALIRLAVRARRMLSFLLSYRAAPADIAAAAVYLATDEAAFVHGAVFDIDGGRQRLYDGPLTAMLVPKGHPRPHGRTVPRRRHIPASAGADRPTRRPAIPPSGAAGRDAPPRALHQIRPISFLRIGDRGLGRPAETELRALRLIAPGVFVRLPTQNHLGDVGRASVKELTDGFSVCADRASLLAA
jgi:hypothetical protein